MISNKLIAIFSLFLLFTLVACSTTQNQEKNNLAGNNNLDSDINSVENVTGSLNNLEQELNINDLENIDLDFDDLT